MKDYKFTEVRPRIFFLNFKDQYRMAMHFLRYQEFYESPSPRFRGKEFTILEFMEWYSKKYDQGAFTYPIDWGGFNIPGDIISTLWNDVGISDRNVYDDEMWEVFSKCKEKYIDGKFYIIGAIGESAAMKHEIAHGFFYTQPEYKNKVTQLVKLLPSSIRKSMNKTLKKIGYASQVYIDECQAYLATGLSDSFDIALIKNERKPFIKIYNEYYNA